MRFMDTNHNIPRRFQLPDSDPDPDQEMFSKEQMETPLSSEPLKREKNTNRGDSVDSFLNMKSSNKKEDSIDLLFMSYARTCKKLSVQKQIQIKLQLAQIFGEAELSELTDS